MFEKLGHVIFKRRKSAVILFIVGILVAGGFGSLAFSRLDSGGYAIQTVTLTRFMSI